MKTLLLKAATLCCIMAFLGACDKDNATVVQQNTSPQAVNTPLERLRTFRNQIQTAKAHPDWKSDETLALSDALWDIENTFNLTYSDAERYYPQINEHEFTLSLPLNEAQEVSVNDAVSLYSQIIGKAREAYASDPLEEKGFISLYISEMEEPVNGTVNITFSGKTGGRTTDPHYPAQMEGPFNEDDNWLFSAPMGKCDDPDIPSGADEQLQEKLYVALIEPNIASTPGYRHVYIDRKRFVFDGTVYQGVFYTQDPEATCIDYQSMNEYYFGEKRIISRTIPEQYHLIGYMPISIEIQGIGLDNPSAITHHNEIEYGICMEVSTDEFGEVEDLLEP